MACSNPKTFNGSIVRCGKCEWCMSLKRWEYRSRILAETVRSERTWFVTLTLRFRMADKTGYRFIQRWLKRLRRKGLSLRYACVAEHGSQSTRRLHYHVVLHGSASLSERAIRSAWRGGISHASLVQTTSEVASYATKMARYTAKGGDRFRFSNGYGSQALAHIYEGNPLVQAAIDAFFVVRASVRIAGSRVHPKLLPELPAPAARDSPELWEEIEQTRRELLQSRAINDRRARQLTYGSRKPKKTD
jgi:hypothetical protein